MQCPVCDDTKRDFICPPCITQQVQLKRSLALASWDAKCAVEAQCAAHALREHARAERRQQLELRRWKVGHMQMQMERERTAVLAAREKVATLRPRLVEQAQRVEEVRATLRQCEADYQLTPEQLRKHLSTAASAAASSAAVAATSTPAVAVEATPLPIISLRWQLSPLFTTTLRQSCHAVHTRLARARLNLISRLLELYVLRRKSPASCSIVGLELMDDPEEMFDARPPPPPQEYPMHVPHPNQQPAPAPPPQMLGRHAPGGPLDGEVVAAALGYIVFVLHLLSCYLSIRLPYPLRFHGSHSYVQFNDGSSTRYFLTLLDNTNPNHFRRAITLLNHNIQFCCTSMGAILAAARAGSTGALALGEAGGAFNLAPLHLLPNMLKLIETIFLALRQQQSETFAQHERQREQVEALQRGPLPISPSHQQQQQLQLEQQQRLFAVAPPLNRPRSSPTSAAAPAVPERGQTPPLDASVSMSMVTVSRQTAGAPRAQAPPPRSAQQQPQKQTGQTQHPPRASSQQRSPPHPVQSSAPASNPRFERLDSPPFYSDHQMRGVAMSTLQSGPLSSPLSRNSSQESPAHSGTASPASSSPHLGGTSSGDLLTPSTFFHLPPNGYLSTEEPRESVLITRPSQQSQQTSRTPRNTHVVQPAIVQSTHRQAFSFSSSSAVERPEKHLSQQHQRSGTEGVSSVGSPAFAARDHFAAPSPLVVSQLDPSHPLHPSHHVLRSPPATPSREAPPQVQQPQASQSPLAAAGGTMYSMLAAAAGEAGAGVLAHLSSPTSWLQEQLVRASESSAQAMRMMGPSPLTAGGEAAQQGAAAGAVAYPSEGEEQWDLVDCVREDDIERHAGRRATDAQRLQQPAQTQQARCMQPHGRPTPPPPAHSPPARARN